MATSKDPLIRIEIRANDSAAVEWIRDRLDNASPPSGYKIAVAEDPALGIKPKELVVTFLLSAAANATGSFAANWILELLRTAPSSRIEVHVVDANGGTVDLSESGCREQLAVRIDERLTAQRQSVRKGVRPVQRKH